MDKAVAKHAKDHEKHVDKVAKAPQLLDEMACEVTELRQMVTSLVSQGGYDDEVLATLSKALESVKLVPA